MDGNLLVIQKWKFDYFIFFLEFTCSCALMTKPPLAVGCIPIVPIVLLL